jgi:hypothetical protein
VAPRLGRSVLAAPHARADYGAGLSGALMQSRGRRPILSWRRSPSHSGAMDAHSLEPTERLWCR